MAAGSSCTRICWLVRVGWGMRWLGRELAAIEWAWLVLVGVIGDGRPLLILDAPELSLGDLGSGKTRPGNLF